MKLWQLILAISFISLLASLVLIAVVAGIIKIVWTAL